MTENYIENQIQETLPSPKQDGRSHIKRKILAIDDSSVNLALLRVIVKKMGHEILLADNGDEGLIIAKQQHPDLILLDIMMPEMDGYEVCRRLKSNSQTQDIPVVFVSAKDQSEDRIAGLELGAVDYIAKPFNQEEMRIRIDIIFQMVRMQEELTSQAYFDELTTLTNRRRFRETLDNEVRHAIRHNQPLSLIMIDIDHFKSTNDTYGHMGGDIILRQVADILKKNTYQQDLAARYGGEEFVLLMPNTDCDKAAAAGEKIREIIKKTQWRISAEDFSLTVSMGLDTIDANSPSEPDELIQRADAALYIAKERGRDRLVRWDHIDITKEDLLLNYDEYQKLENQLTRLGKNIRAETAQTLSDLINRAMVEKDPEGANDTIYVQTYVQALADEMKLPESLTENILLASQLYNLGKISIPDRILNKTSKLSAQERQIIEQLPLISLKLLQSLGVFDEQLVVIRHRYENYNGSGYPSGFKGQSIPFGSRILAVADSFNAMTSNRPYQKALGFDEALAELEKCSGSQFDPEVVRAFLRVAQEHKEDWPLHAKQLVEAKSV